MGGGKNSEFKEGDPLFQGLSDSDSDTDLPIQSDSPIGVPKGKNGGRSEIVSTDYTTIDQPVLSVDSKIISTEKTAIAGSSEPAEASNAKGNQLIQEEQEIVALKEFLEKLEEALGGTSVSAKRRSEAAIPEVSEGEQSQIASSVGVVETKNEDIVQDTNKVVFVRDNVAIRPASSKQEYLPGCLCLLWRDSLLLMTWLPYPPRGNSDSDAEMVAIQGNAIKEVAVADFHSVRRFSPALGYHYIIIALKSGLALQPLYFLSGGVKDFLTSLQMHAALTRSKENKDRYLVNLVRDPLRKSLTQLGLPETVAPSRLSTLRPKDTWLVVGDDGDSLLEESVMPEGSEKKVEIPTKTKSNKKKPPKVEEIALNVLEKLSFVTKLARDTTTQLIAGLMEEEPEIRRELNGFREPMGSFPGRPVRGEVGHWSSGSQGLKKKVVTSEVHEVDLLEREKQPPLGVEEWGGMLDKEGRVKDSESLKKRVFFGGVEPDLRPEVWKFLLGYFSFSSTRAERQELRERKALEYAALRDQWQGVSEEEANSREGFLDQVNAVDKDVTRTDPKLPFYEGENNPNVVLLRSILITYAFYNPDLSYCQGMCDLLSPLLFVLQDEAEAFWCFSSLMERTGPNFRLDQNGMQLQLVIVAKLVELLDPELHAYFRTEDCLNYFFCFRWIFLQFKREFSFEEVLSLWEILWTRHLTPHFHLFMCVGVLQENFPTMQEEQMDFETILRFVNDLSSKIDLNASIAKAQRLVVKTSQLVELQNKF